MSEHERRHAATGGHPSAAPGPGVRQCPGFRDVDGYLDLMSRFPLHWVAKDAGLASRGDVEPDRTSVRLGAAIRARRIEVGMTQAELADLLGLARSRLGAIENGRVGQFRLLVEVSTALGLELVALPRGKPGTAPVVSEQERLFAAGRRRAPRRRPLPG